MKRALILVSLFAFVLLLAVGCGSNKPATTTGPATDSRVENVPDWYMNKHEDPNYHFGTGTGTSRDMQVARDKAMQNALQQISSEIEQKFEGLRKMFQEEVGTADESHYLEQFTQTSQSVASQVLRNAKMEDSEFQNEDGVYRAYVLYSLPVGATLEDLNNRLSQEEEMYTRFRSSQAFDEMDKQIQEYEEFKQQQGN